MVDVENFKTRLGEHLKFNKLPREKKVLNFYLWCRQKTIQCSFVKTSFPLKRCCLLYRPTNKSHKKLIFHQILYHPWNSLLVINIILCVRSIINKNIYSRWDGKSGKELVSERAVHWIISKIAFRTFYWHFFPTWERKQRCG